MNRIQVRKILLPSNLKIRETVTKNRLEYLFGRERGANAIKRDGHGGEAVYISADVSERATGAPGRAKRGLSRHELAPVALGGMGADGAPSSLFMGSGGAGPDRMAMATRAFETTLAAGGENLIVYDCDAETLPKYTTPRASAGEARPATPHPDLLERTEDYLKGVIAGVIKLDPDRIDVHEDFGRYIVDSLVIMALNAELGKPFPGLPRTLFFEYLTIHEMVNLFYP